VNAAKHGVATACLAVGLIAAVPSGGAAQKKDPAAILAAARAALGGERKLSSVKSFTATGRTRQVRGDNLVPIEFEISVELPDKYLRKDEIPAQETGVSGAGFNGDELILDPPPAAALPEPARKARTAALKQDFARLALGMFAASFPAYPLTFTYAGEAQAPQGTADVLDAKGADNMTLRLFIHSETHLPIMVSWKGPAAGARGARGGPPPELWLYFGDYRDVDGLQLPFRLRRATGADTTEETTFDRFKLNPKIDPKKFQAVGQRKGGLGIGPREGPRK